jgi:exosortase E/protease (VPEID-CTERM system)
VPFRWSRWNTLGLPARAAILAALLFLEKIFLTQFVDTQRAWATGTRVALLLGQQLGFRFIVAFITALTVFAAVRREAQQSLPIISRDNPAPFRPLWMLAHLVLLGCLTWLTSLLFPTTPAPIPFELVVSLWLVFGAAGVFCAFAAVAPSPVWLQGARALGRIWIYAILAALAAAAAIPSSRDLWWSTTAATFRVVSVILRPILPGLIVDPVARLLGTQRFTVEILAPCSGLEGMSLILVFTTVWLWYFRKEYRFPRALWLIPVGLVLMFGMNAVRIAMLILIGNAGYPEVAVYGFHSQAGWIAFNAVAVGIAVWSRRSRWLSRGETLLEPHRTDNPTAGVLMPLLAILAAGMLSHALSGRFEWFYPLRLFAGCAALWIYRDRLRALEWRWSWRGVLLGTVVFIMWTVGAHLLGTDPGMPQALASASPSQRWLWIVCRVAATMGTVPLAEELAFRGFLMRRVQDRNFEALDYRQVGWLALVVSSVGFGVAHGAMWLPGIVAGFAYGWIVKRRGQLGEAVIAHATTNLLVVALALGLGDWSGF